MGISCRLILKEWVRGRCHSLTVSCRPSYAWFAQLTSVVTPFFAGAPWYTARFKNLSDSSFPTTLDTLFVTVFTTI